MGQYVSRATTGAAQSAADAQQQHQADDPFPWYFRYGAKLLGIVGGILCMAFGLWALVMGGVTLSLRCIASGALEMLLGFFMVALEGPFLCLCIEFIGKIQAFSDSRPPLHKFLLYCVTSVVPVVLCFDLSTFLGCAIVFCCGLMYGVMAFGRKADQSAMTAAAGGVPDAVVSGGTAAPPPYSPYATSAPAPYDDNPWRSEPNKFNP